MGWCNGCLLYLNIFYSFTGSYTPNIEWFSDLPGISITTERFFQYSETINYQATNIFSSNKYHLERKEKNLEDYFHLLRERSCAVEEDKKFEKKSLWMILYKPVVLTANICCKTTLSFHIHAEAR